MSRAGPDIEEKILALCRKHPLDGVEVYQEIAVDEAAKQRGLGKEDHLVLQELKAAGSKGMWTKTLRRNTNLAPALVARALKNLETRQLVKSIKGVQNATKKLYMLAELEPAKELTGGAWYTDQNFDLEFFSVLQRASRMCIGETRLATLDDVASYLRDKQITNVELRDEDVLSVLRTLEYERAIECRRGLGEDDEDVFREERLPLPERHAATAFPCGICPVIGDCVDDGPVSPATCPYWKQYLDF
ncbi:hypothetical protein WJX81_000452 [Elliptochloris bilobata]|uniref:DNA-directed RNA polymerase III subunit RPC6 n=1 Tax=Elliptochloris bilobata TaxID=381761 RepID=A0AAW1RAT7_9CHLO